jgi:hypothetical protein
MRILWTNHALDHPAGTEIFTRDLTRELHRRGHEVEIFCTRAGVLAEELRAQGLPVHTDPRTLAGKFDLIHGQHFVETAVALAALPGVPALFFCHGATSGDWIEHPPFHPRVARWLTTCENLRQHLARAFDHEASAIGVVANPVDIAALPDAAAPAWPPRRAVVFHNTRTMDSPEWEHAERVCRETGIALRGLGAGFGNRSPRPWDELAEVDLVFASGRCAMEAMAMDRAVVILGPGYSGGLAGPGDYPALAASNFTRTTRELAWSDRIDFGPSSAEAVEAITRLGTLVRENHSLARVADQLEQIHREVAGPRVESDEFVESMANAVNLHVAWRQMLANHDQARTAERKLTRLEEKLARSNDQRQSAENRLKSVKSLLQGTWWGRRVWRSLPDD